jgi:DNA-binding SARP family transcriptional activator
MSGWMGSESLAGAAALRAYMLGPPRVEWGGQPLPLPRRQTRALLYRLAVRPEPVPREQLCFLFWPDTPESTARRNLTHLLTHLRRALPEPDLLLIAEDCIGLDPRFAWSDVGDFERLCAALPSSSLRLSSLPTLEEAESLQQAVDLYRGPFLAGFSLPGSPEFETWADQARYVWERLYLEALAALMEGWAASGEYDPAIACARRYLETDELAEDVHRRLIQFYAAVGDRRAALRQFECCTVVLERELGVSPLPETRAVYQAVLAHQPVPRQAAPPAWTTLPGLDVPLVGRDAALRHLEQAYARVQAGHGEVVLISGEAGIGKSRLMQDFATSLSDQALILVGTAQSAMQTMPYQPVVEALRLALNLQPVSGDLQPIWLAEVSRLLPELRTLYPDLPPLLPAEPEEARGRLFEALSQFILGLTTSPLLLCLDDLHWADSATLDWLAYLGRHLPGNRLLVLGTYRSEESDAVAGLRRHLARLGILSEVKLAGLDAAAVLQLVRYLTLSPNPPPPLLSGKKEGAGGGGEVALAHRLQVVTGGNPFFLLEILRALVETGGWPVHLASVEDFPLPDTVRDAVDARLRRLSPVARQVLEAGAVVGPAFGLDLVCLVAGRREMETMDGLDELVARQLLVESRGGAQSYLPFRFQHEIVWRVVEEGMSPARRQLLHRRAGRALERLEPEAVPALARHFDAGGEVQKALHYHGLAAQRAEALFAWREAEEHQSRMLALLEWIDPQCSQPDCLAQRGRVLTARAHQRYLQGRLAERDADLAALAALAEVSGDEHLCLQAALLRTRYLNLAGQYEAAIAAAEAGLADFAPSPGSMPLTLCHLLVEVGFAHYLLGQPREALAALESTLTIAGDQARPEIQGPIAHNLGYVYLHLGEYDRALAYQQEAYACHQAAGDYNGMAWAGLDMGFLYLKMGRLPEAEEHLTGSLVLARRIGARPAEAYALTYSGYRELYQGDYAAAADRFQQTLPMHQAVRQEHGAVAAEAGRGLALYHLGDLDEARRWLERAAERARSIGHRRRLAEALVGLGLVELKDNRLRAARRCLAEAVELAHASECRESLAAGLAALARTERGGGDPASALVHAGEAVRVAQEGPLPVCQMWGEMEVGLALLSQGQPVAALEHTGRAVALLPQAHEGWIGTEEVHRAHARVLQALGRIEEADEHVRRAEAIIVAKAGHISDSGLRRRYLERVKRKT